MLGFVFYNNNVCTVVCEGRYFTISMFARLCVRVCILITSRKHLHDLIISLRGEGEVNRTSLTPPHFIEVPVLSQERGQSCISVLIVSNLPLSIIFDWILNFFGSVVLYVFNLIILCWVFNLVRRKCLSIIIGQVRRQICLQDF